MQKLPELCSVPASAVTRKDARPQAHLQEFLPDLKMRGPLIDPPARGDLGDAAPIASVIQGYRRAPPGGNFAR